MRQVTLLAVDDAQILDDIITAKYRPRKARLQAVRDDVIVAYQDYVDAAPAVENLPPIELTALQAGALRHAYEVETVPMTKLRTRLMSRIVVSRCPFCGLSESSTLDHYLPKELYPQFSVLSKNLVPCCASCNTRKGELVVDEETAVRLFFHPYFDEIPGDRFIAIGVTLLPDALGLNYRTVRAAGIGLRTFRRLRSHFKLLRLADRYRIMSLEHLRSRYHALARFYGPGEDADRVAAELLQEAEDFEAEYGANHWRAILYRGLAAHDDFCDGGFEVLKQIQ